MKEPFQPKWPWVIGVRLDKEKNAVTIIEHNVNTGEQKHVKTECTYEEFLRELIEQKAVLDQRSNEKER